MVSKRLFPELKMTLLGSLNGLAQLNVGLAASACSFFCLSNKLSILNLNVGFAGTTGCAGFLNCRFCEKSNRLLTGDSLSLSFFCWSATVELRGFSETSGFVGTDWGFSWTMRKELMKGLLKRSLFTKNFFSSFSLLNAFFSSACLSLLLSVRNGFGPAKLNLKATGGAGGVGFQEVSDTPLLNLNAPGGCDSAGVSFDCPDFASYFTGCAASKFLFAL